MKLLDILNWNNIRKRIEKRDLLLLGVIGALLLILFLYGVWFRPKMRELQKFRRELYALRIQRKDTETIGDISRLKEEIGRIEDRIKEKRFKRNELPRALELLKDHISRYRLELVSLTPELREVLFTFDLAPDLTFETIPIHMRLRGRYAAFGECLGALSELPFLTRVERFEMESPPTVFPKIEAQLTLSLYVEKGEDLSRGK